MRGTYRDWRMNGGEPMIRGEATTRHQRITSFQTNVLIELNVRGRGSGIVDVTVSVERACR